MLAITFHPHHGRRTPRRGGIVVEMMFVLLVLVGITIGLIYFGTFFANDQQVALAARNGALRASQLPSLSQLNGDAVPADVLRIVTDQLESSHIRLYSVRLEHNVNPDHEPVVLESVLSSGLERVVHNALPSSPGVEIAPSQYVRLTVCVPADELFPSQLSFFGVRLYDATRTCEHTVLLRYEFDEAE